LLFVFSGGEKIWRYHNIRLAQVHVQLIDQLREQYVFFRAITGNAKLYNEIRSKKTAEYALADKILCLSNFAADSLFQNGILKTKVAIVNLGVNSQLFKAKEEYTSNESEPLKLLFVGTVTLRKGVDFLLATLVKISHLNITTTIIGPVGDGFQIQSYLKSDLRITYYPFLHHEQLAKKMQACDVFVFPSFLDSWAMVVIEAMASGLPVIITENTGAAEAVTNKAGIVIKTGNKEQLQEAIEYYYHNRSQIKTVGLHARSIAEQYSWENYSIRLRLLIDTFSDT
jgi:glycosyltransferase involved in cell wall biosynthesis